MSKQYTEKEILELKEKLFSHFETPLDKHAFGDIFLNLDDGDLLTQLIDGLEHPEKYC